MRVLLDTPALPFDRATPSRRLIDVGPAFAPLLAPLPLPRTYGTAEKAWRVRLVAFIDFPEPASGYAKAASSMGLPGIAS